jgi:hypothetical protein
MSSPVRENKLFIIRNAQPNKFIDLGLEFRTPSVKHTAFFSHSPLSEKFKVGEDLKQINGYFRYRFLYNEIDELLVGIVFYTYGKKTQVSDNKLIVSDRSSKNVSYTPNLFLDKMGVKIYVGNDSSVLAVTSMVTKLLVTE